MVKKMHVEQTAAFKTHFYRFIFVSNRTYFILILCVLLQISLYLVFTGSNRPNILIMSQAACM